MTEQPPRTTKCPRETSSKLFWAIVWWQNSHPERRNARERPAQNYSGPLFDDDRTAFCGRISVLDAHKSTAITQKIITLRSPRVRWDLLYSCETNHHLKIIHTNFQHCDRNFYFEFTGPPGGVCGPPAGGPGVCGPPAFAKFRYRHTNKLLRMMQPPFCTYLLRVW